jgi:hypothetical protein
MGALPFLSTALAVGGGLACSLLTFQQSAGQSGLRSLALLTTQPLLFTSGRHSGGAAGGGLWQAQGHGHGRHDGMDEEEGAAAGGGGGGSGGGSGDGGDGGGGSGGKQL